ncbi:hypothetical protein BVX95_00185 [archaeon D22]|nr:hypothetical protein BVX95_00185 [archaeon D22]
MVEEHQGKEEKSGVSISIMFILSLFFMISGAIVLLRLLNIKTIAVIDNLSLEILTWPIAAGSFFGGLYMLYKRIFKIPWRVKRMLHHSSKFK